MFERVAERLRKTLPSIAKSLGTRRRMLMLFERPRVGLLAADSGTRHPDLPGQSRLNGKCHIAPEKWELPHRMKEAASYNGHKSQ